MESASRRTMNANTCLLLDGHIGPALAAENGGNGEALDTRLNGVEILVEEEEKHRRFVERDHVGLGVERVSLCLVLLAVCVIHEPVELRVAPERHVAADTLVPAVQQRKQEILGVGIVSPPLLEREI